MSTKKIIESHFPEFYKGFKLISKEYVPDCNSAGIYLRHEKTGLEIFHLLNEDEENLFAFTFRTPVKNSTGAAHILEHSVFCGSEKFPLKEPFTNLMNQSVNTFLNAMTYSDKTVYPASSVVKNDYYNLMDVYGDAVFFPLLKKEAFMQEAHRLEIKEDKKGKPSFEIQGVVYNEMKGCYSSFDSVANDIQLRSIFPETNYSYDSGGDPLFIPTFTYEDFLAFHKKYYSPENCLLFLYGNIPTEEQIDFLNEKLISRIEKKYSQVVNPFSRKENLSLNPQNPFVNPEFVEIETPSEITEPLIVKQTAPSSGATGSLVTVNWNCGESADLNTYMECSFLSELLIGNDGSPLAKVLQDSELGDDLAPISGTMNETRFFNLSFGLHGVKKGDEEKVRSLIFETLEKVRREGIDKSHVEAALVSAEFALRENTRANGPFSLVHLEHAANAWNYGKDPRYGLLYKAAFDKIRNSIETDKDYISHLLDRFVFSNKKCVFVTVEPSDKYLSEREKKEKSLIEEKSKLTEEEVLQLKEALNALHSYQQYHETEEDVSCMPTLKLSDLSGKASSIKTDFLFVREDGSSLSEAVSTIAKENTLSENGSSGVKADGSSFSIPVVRNIENTNGIVYFEVGFPIDSLTPSDCKYLTLFSCLSPSCGWSGKNWAETSLQTALCSGGISARILTQETPSSESAKAHGEKYQKYNILKRDWIFFSIRLLSELLEEGLSLFQEFLGGFEFTDVKRVKTLFSEVKSSVKSSIIPHGNKFASIRTQALKTHSGALDELTRGFSQFYFLNEIAKKDEPTKAEAEKLSVRLTELKKKIFANGGIIHFTSDAETAEKVEKLIPDFIKKSSLTPVKEKNSTFTDEAFFNEMILPGEDKHYLHECFVAKSQVGFAASSMEGSCLADYKNAQEIFLSHWLSGNLLWERIRTTGGAYGAYASSANLSGQFLFATFRDPSPVKSLSTFVKCLEDVTKMEITDQEAFRSITGTYGDEVQPHSPGAKGRLGLTRLLFCITDEDRSKKLSDILSLSAKDLKEASSRILKASDKMKTCVVCTKKESSSFEKKCGVIINLPL